MGFAMIDPSRIMGKKAHAKPLASGFVALFEIMNPPGGVS